ncbi:Got1-like family protein, partial [Endogone sp. FLAS-F59071]
RHASSIRLTSAAKPANDKNPRNFRQRTSVYHRAAVSPKPKHPNTSLECGCQTLKVRHVSFYNCVRSVVPNFAKVPTPPPSCAEIGVGLTAFGLFFMVIGVVMFFDGGLLAIGNILFLSGTTAIIGPMKTFAFFARKQKIRGTICFLGGIFLVFLKWPFVGMCVETFGFLNLFGDFFPVIFSFLRRVPVIGPILSNPTISRVCN